MGHLRGTHNVPLAGLWGAMRAMKRRVAPERWQAMLGVEIWTLCRAGNDSQRAGRRLRDELGFTRCFDVEGGLMRWKAEVDGTLPML